MECYSSTAVIRTGEQSNDAFVCFSPYRARGDDRMCFAATQDWGQAEPPPEDSEPDCKALLPRNSRMFGVKAKGGKKTKSVLEELMCAWLGVRREKERVLQIRTANLLSPRKAGVISISSNDASESREEIFGI